MYKTANGYTKQKMIDKVNSDFKGRAYCENTHFCAYLTDDGKKCAIGLFIPDGHEAQRMQETVYTLLKTYTDLNQFMPLEEISGLAILQMIHDHVGFSGTIIEQKQKLIKWINDNVVD